MKLFSKIPDRFFSVLASGNKELYVQALFVLRQAFKTELVIRRDELTAMLMDALEADILEADFSEEAEEEGDLREGEANNLSGKARLLLRRLQETGWIETEYESGTFQENITIPDYAILVMNLLYDLSQERVREYNSYVYATYASLANAAENPEYIYQALQAAYQNTVRLVDELKSLFNNIRAYYRRIPGEDDVNILLAEHFDEYKEKVFDAVYYPLKTIDSVPRFKHAIISILNEWLMNDEVQNAIVEQGVARRVWDGEENGRGEMLRIINYVIDTYEGIEEMIGEIDRKHVEYTRASVEHIRYLMNADRGTKGKLIELLKHSGDREVAEMMADSIGIYRHRFYDDKSLYAEVKRTRREMGEPLPLAEPVEDAAAVRAFLEGIRSQYTNARIDSYVRDCFGGRDTYSTEEVPVDTAEDFVLFLMSTIRGQERSAFFTAEFLEGDLQKNGSSLPRVLFRKKRRRDAER